MRVGLAQQVLDLVDLVAGVDGHEDGADLDGRPEREVPLRHVRRPDGHVVARPDAHGDEGAGAAVDVVPELGVGARVVALRVAERVLVGELLADAVEHLREGEVDEVLLGPDVLALTAQGRLEPFRRGHLREVAVHVVLVLREHDARPLDGHVLGPCAHPFERHVAVEVDLVERVEHLREGHVALAHEAVANVAVLDDGVLHVAVADVAAEVGDRGLAGFAEVAVRVVQVPERGDVGAGDGVEDAAQAGRVGVVGRSLEQQRHVLLGGGGTKLAAEVDDVVVIDHGGRRRLADGEDAHVRGAHVVCEVDVARDLGDVRLAVVLLVELAAAREAGDLEAEAVERGLGPGPLSWREGPCIGGLERLSESADLDAVEAEVGGHGVDVGPVVVWARDG